MNKNSKIYIAGHRGLAGSALLKTLKEKGYNNILCRTHKELDLQNREDTYDFFESEKPDYVILAAAKVGGILANNDFPVDFLLNNLDIQNNVISAAHKVGVKKLLFLGSSCIYPRDCPQPMKEEYLLTGVLEKTNEPYAIAKIAGIKLCESYYRQYGDKFFSVMPTNLYGPNDNFDLKSSHVLPALMRKIHEAKVDGDSSVEIWGTGKPFREFLHCDDMAKACIYLLENFEGNDLFNIGCGEDLSIADLAKLIAKVVGYTGDFVFNEKYPDGTPKKLQDVSKLKGLGWKPELSLEQGLKDTYEFYKKTA